MKSTKRYAILGALVLVIVGIGLKVNIPYVSSFSHFVAGAFFAERFTPEVLKDKYKQNRTISVLVVPGHDLSNSGTVFNGVREFDLNVKLARGLVKYFQNDSRFIVSSTHNLESGANAAWFTEYVTKNKNEIEAFRTTVRDVANTAIQHGYYTKNVGIEHNPAADNTSLNLYAINKIANDATVDIVLHVHFNDYPRRWRGSAGEYKGFAVYIPEAQLPNSRVSRSVAESVYKTVNTVVASSNLPGESAGVIEDQELIAIGSNASRDGVSILMEYSYIYEPAVQNSESREIFLDELAYQTYKGIKTYFDEGSGMASSSVLPYTWKKNMNIGDRGEDVFALQVALTKDGMYPPQNKSRYSCPISGYYGSCTASAVSAFQKKYISYSTGAVGPLTIKHLNTLYNE